jgi:hypothetical protein
MTVTGDGYNIGKKYTENELKKRKPKTPHGVIRVGHDMQSMGIYYKNKDPNWRKGYMEGMWDALIKYQSDLNNEILSELMKKPNFYHSSNVRVR